MTWVKICGITNLEDAQIAVEAGADALGFVFYEKSPRNVSAETAREIVRQLPARVEKVGVFVNHDSEQIREMTMSIGLTAVQVHGKEAQTCLWKDPRPAEESVGVSKVIPVIHGDSLKGGGIRIQHRAIEKIFALLLDSHSKSAPGGTGKTFDWEETQRMVQGLSLMVPIVVAGGLTELNVRKALEMFQPFGVDVASGVESNPGKKDPEKVRAFITAVRAADRKA